MRGEFPAIELTEEQEAEAARIEDVLNAKARVMNRYMSRLLASKSNRDLFGETEFQIRDAVHRLGADGIDAALEERKKRVSRDESRLRNVRRGREIPRLPGLPSDDAVRHSDL